MTENEKKMEALEVAIKALEEVQQYRAIGTLEECRKSVEIYKAMLERNITVGNIEEYMKFEDECVEKGFSFKSLLEARDKQEKFKPTQGKVGVGRCKCGVEFLNKNTKYCGNCGQKLDWSDEE